MLMIPPSGGDAFTGRDGFAFNSATGVQTEIGQGDVQQALLRGWTQVAYPVTVQTLVPLTGFTYAVPNPTMQLILKPAGTLATGTITLPPNPFDQQIFRVTTTQTVTALTMNANTGQTLNGAPTTITSTTPVDVFYNAADTTWYRR